MRFTFGWRRVRLPPLESTRDRFLPRTHRLIRALAQSFTRAERWLLAGCLAAAVVAGTQIVRYAPAGAAWVPASGGIYREGVLTTAARDLDAIDNALTKISLVKLGTTGALEPALATEWQVSDDAQTTRVRIHDGVTAQQVVDVLKQQTETGYWKEAEVSIPDPHSIEFHVSKPWAGFVTELVTPIFPYGPYEKTAQTQADILTYASRRGGIITPLIPTVEIHLYRDTKSLERAARKNNLDGIFTPDQTPIALPAGWQASTPSLLNETILFFNLRHESLGAAARGQLVRGERLDAPLDLHLAVAENGPTAVIAADLANRWKSLGANVIVEQYPLLTLTKTILPQRQYDAVLLGVDYGADGDLYPYWHSSQIADPGQNLGGYRNKDVDRLLDESRRLSDPAQRHQRYQAVRQIITGDNAFISFGSPTVSLARSPKVKGAVPERLLTATSRWTDIEKWYMKEKRVPRAAPEPSTNNK